MIEMHGGTYRETRVLDAQDPVNPQITVETLTQMNTSFTIHSVSCNFRLLLARLGRKMPYGITIICAQCCVSCIFL